MRIVDAESLIDIVRSYADTFEDAIYIDYEAVITFIDELAEEAPNVVRVVRCRNCRCFQPYEIKGICTKSAAEHSENDFCSYGKMKV